MQLFDQLTRHVRLRFALMATLCTLTVSVIVVAGHEDPISQDDPSLMERNQPTTIVSFLCEMPAWVWRMRTTYAFGFQPQFLATIAILPCNCVNRI